MLVVVVALAGAAAAFRRGDPIPVSDRVNFNGQTSAWGEILLMVFFFVFLVPLS